MSKSKVAKLHHRLVRKHHDIQWHKKAIQDLLGVLGIYANSANWKLTDRTRDVMQRGVVIGVEQILEWNGPSNGPQLAEQLTRDIRGASSDKQK